MGFGDPCNWRTDLYRGDGETTPSFGDRLLDPDWVENEVCVAETTPTTIASQTSGPTTTTISVGGSGGETTTTIGAATAVPTTTETLVIGLLDGTLVGLGTLARRVVRS